MSIYNAGVDLIALNIIVSNLDPDENCFTVLCYGGSCRDLRNPLTV